ncbi:FxLD family lanthipeptide [Actinocorallia sp. API 0066]|uniref:FxLD family lanthipeptide n=1 Tax=Actinocorallia sp. API 0066 TaxID=2896846 RepID=UPI001E4199AC|nr:FxLD family lanthipeptide [Actinocorallia sp. API 0066]MCD0451366.1 FxLD family lanthipeptide [Actinocorallia sp. API 0066]
MSTPTIDQQSAADTAADGAAVDFDPFGLDITFIEDTPAADTILMCSTNDTCGSSCPSACTTS